MIERRGGGTIMGISGCDTRAWVPTHGILAGAKAAMETTIRYLAVETGDSGVTILGVNPGAIRTDSVDVMPTALGEIARVLRPGGRLVLVEYRGEDPRVPIKRLHKMTEEQSRREMRAAGLEWVRTEDFLPQQHFMVFRRPPGETG